MALIFYCWIEVGYAIKTQYFDVKQGGAGRHH